MTRLDVIISLINFSHKMLYMALGIETTLSVYQQLNVIITCVALPAACARTTDSRFVAIEMQAAVCTHACVV